MKKILLFILCFSLIISSLILASCGDDICTEHKDDDKNSVCDNCGEMLTPPEKEPCDLHTDADSDGECDVCGESLGAPAPKEVTLTFNVKDQYGKALTGITPAFKDLSNDNSSLVFATPSADGTLTAKLKTGKYFVTYDYDVDAIGYYLTDTSEITVTADMTTVDLILIDNNPNGTLERPFPLSVGENDVIVPANSSYYYIVYRAVKLYVGIEKAGISVTYGEDVYTPDSDGSISFALNGVDTNSAEIFVINNTTASDLTFTVKVNSLPGTSGNPFVIENLGEEITVENIEKDTIIYYSYTATASGKIELKLNSENSYASMINTRNSVAVNTSDSLNGVITVEVLEGDEILIDCTVTAEGASSVSFVIDRVQE